MDNWKSLFQQLWWETHPQTNYHGTPNTFSEFDDSKLLTGEGANVHGSGHYSARNKDVAEMYRDILSRNKNEYDYIYEIDYKGHKFTDNDKGFDWRKYNSLKDIAYGKTTKDKEVSRLLRNLDFYKNEVSKDAIKQYKDYIKFIKDVDTKEFNHINKGNTYRVNVPNKNFMLDFTKPFDNQSKYVQDALYQMFKSDDVSKNVKDLWMELNRFKPEDTKYIYDWLAEDIGSNISDEFKWASFDTQRKAGAPKASEIFNKYGIKGISTTGRSDGPINVTFTGRNIKMANTPLQIVANRIPTQTLGKMANKAYNTPAVKQAIRFLPAIGTAEMILQGLSQPVGDATVRPKKDVLKEYLPLTQGVYNYGKY